MNFAWLILLGCLLTMASGCSNERPRAVQKNTEYMLTELTLGEDDAARASAAKQLGISRDSRALEPLVEALRDKALPVRIAAVEALGEIRDPRAIDPLIGALIKDYRDVKVVAARTLARFHDIRAAEALVQSLNVIEDDAIAALVSLDQGAVPALLNGIRDSTTRTGAIKALTFLGPAAVDPLIEVARHDTNAYAKVAAIAALADIDDPRAREALLPLLEAKNANQIAAGYRYLIRNGKSGTEDMLIASLRTFGTPAMVRDFVYSGNPALKKAGEEFVRTNRLVPPAPETTGTAPVWGKAQYRSVQTRVFHFDDSLESTDGAKPAETKGISFVPGKWGKAVAITADGVLSYPVGGNLRFDEGTVAMWISPKYDGKNPIYGQSNHPLLFYGGPGGDQFIISHNTQRSFYAGTFVRSEFAGIGLGDMSNWRAGDWHHVAFAFSRKGSKRLSIDGTQVAEYHAPMASPQAGTPNFLINCNTWGQSGGFFMDELLVSSEPQSLLAIQAAANRTKPYP